MRREFEARRNLVCRRLSAMPGVRCRVPEGAFYAFFDVSAHFGRTLGGRKVTDSASFCSAALETANVNVVPGSAFGAEGYVRLSYATSREQLNGGWIDWRRGYADRCVPLVSGLSELTLRAEARPRHRRSPDVRCTMAVLLLNEDDVRRLVTMDMALEAVEAGLRKLALDEAQNVPRARVQTDHCMMHSMAASIKTLGVMGAKVYATSRKNPAHVPS